MTQKHAKASYDIKYCDISLLLKIVATSNTEIKLKQLSEKKYFIDLCAKVAIQWELESSEVAQIITSSILTKSTKRLFPPCLALSIK